MNSLLLFALLATAAAASVSNQVPEVPEKAEMAKVAEVPEVAVVPQEAHVPQVAEVAKEAEMTEMDEPGEIEYDQDGVPKRTIPVERQSLRVGVIGPDDRLVSRMSRPTHQQLETLVDFLVQNPGIAKGLLRTAQAKQESKRKWGEIAESLNALGGPQKDGKGWAKYWADKKFTLKRTRGQHAQSMRRTGGGVAENLPALTPIDQRLVAVMGGLQFAAGDSHVAANPFPSTSQSDIHLEFVIPTDEKNLDANELESHASPTQNVETLRVITPREHSPRRTSLSAGQRVQSRTMLDQDRDRFAEIERQRVEAETITARALSRAIELMEDLPIAIREGSQTVADALIRIADALSQNRQ